MRLRRRGDVALATAALIAVSVVAHAESQPFPIGPHLDLRPPPGVSAVDKLRLAVLSVHAYVEKRRGRLGSLLANTSTMRPSDAAETIRSPGPLDGPPGFSELRRRVMATRLLAHAREDQEAVEAVKILLGVRETERILQLLMVADHPQPLGGEEAQVADAIVAVMGPPSDIGTCSSWEGSSYVDWVGTGNDISITVLGEAGQTMDKARQGLDPQSWSCSTLWEKTCLAKMKADGTPETDPNGVPVCAPGKTLGSIYDGELYEHFVCGPAKLCSIRLLLHVSTAWMNAGQEYLVLYSDPRQVPPPRPGEPTVVVDRGSVKASKAGPKVQIRTEKIFGFADPVDTAKVYLILQAIDLSFHLSELVCCF